MHVDQSNIKNISPKFVVKFSELLLGGSSDKINVSDMLQSFQLVLRLVQFAIIINFIFSVNLVVTLRVIVCCGMRESSLLLWMVTSK